MPIIFTTDDYFRGQHWVSIEFFGRRLCLSYETESGVDKIVEIFTIGM